MYLYIYIKKKITLSFISCTFGVTGILIYLPYLKRGSLKQLGNRAVETNLAFTSNKLNRFVLI